jgi:hypothetical protein
MERRTFGFRKRFKTRGDRTVEKNRVSAISPDLSGDAVVEISGELRKLLADVFKFAEERAQVTTNQRQNTSASLYSDPGSLTVGSARSFVIQHLTEVAKDHENGIFAGTNSYIAEIGAHQPMTVEEFVTRNRGAFV